MGEKDKASLTKSQMTFYKSGPIIHAMQTVGDRIKRELGKRRWKAPTLARELNKKGFDGLTKQAVYAWMRGEAPSTPDDDKLRAIAEIFGVSFDYLKFGGEPGKPAPTDEIYLQAFEVVERELAARGLEVPIESKLQLIRLLVKYSTQTRRVDASVLKDILDLPPIPSK